jgi:hypothetical protein
MGFNSVFKGLKLLKNPGNWRLNNLNYPILNVLNSPGIEQNKKTELYCALFKIYGNISISINNRLQKDVILQNIK